MMEEMQAGSGGHPEIERLRERAERIMDEYPQLRSLAFEMMDGMEMASYRDDALLDGVMGLVRESEDA